MEVLPGGTEQGQGGFDRVMELGMPGRSHGAHTRGAAGG